MGIESSGDKALDPVNDERDEASVSGHPVESKNLEKEITSVNEDIVERRRVEITRDMKMADIMAQYKVSKTTAWRALQRAQADPEGHGWLFINYHVKEINIDEKWAEQHHQALVDDANFGTRLAIQRMKRTPGSVDAFLSPFSFEDLEQEAYIRLLQLSGRIKDRENPHWRRGVALRAAADIIRSNIVRHQSRHAGQSLESLEETF